MPRRRGRPGLVGTMARTAVVAGTATAVAGSVSDRRRAKGEQQAADAQAQAAEAQPAPPPAPAEDDTMAKVEELGAMHAKGLLTDEEFAAAKAKLLGI